MSVRLCEHERARLDTAASANGRSLANEVEHRLSASFRNDDLRQIIREEIRAALNDVIPGAQSMVMTGDGPVRASSLTPEALHRALLS